jgi:c-di-GMP-binding flagellar brake protein YcgR
MAEVFNKQRRYTRIFFSDSEKAGGVISPMMDQDKSFPSSILNISEGGLQFNQKRQEYRGLQPGDMLLLRRIIGLQELIGLANIPMQIKWVMDNEYLDHVVMGVAFTELTDSQRQPLQSFINTCLTLHQEEEKS